MGNFSSKTAYFNGLAIFSSQLSHQPMNCIGSDIFGFSSKTTSNFLPVCLQIVSWRILGWSWCYFTLQSYWILILGAIVLNWKGGGGEGGSRGCFIACWYGCFCHCCPWYLERRDLHFLYQRRPWYLDRISREFSANALMGAACPWVRVDPPLIGFSPSFFIVCLHTCVIKWEKRTDKLTIELVDRQIKKG